jgi:SAM-dependent methyltransferase
MIACPSCAGEMRNEHDACPQCGFEPQVIDGFTAWAPELAYAGGGFKSEGFNHLAELEAANFWFRARNELIVWALRRHFGSLTSFLEVGCGTGYVLNGVSAAFPNARMVGSELFVNGLRHAAARSPKATLVQMDARRTPYIEEFDVAIAVDVIEHIDEDAVVLAQLHRAVKPGGGIIISVPQHTWLWSQADDYACHVRRYTAEGLHSQIKAAGFCLELSTSFVSLLLPLMLASRLAKQDSGSYDPRAEFEIPRALNAILGQVLRAERAMIAAGVRFPVGGSRFVVARKLG